MQNDILEMMEKEIARLFKHLGTLTPGSEEYEHVRQDLVNLEDRRAKECANILAAKELELKEKEFVYNEDKDNNDTLLRQQEIDAHKKDRLIAGVGSVINGLAVIGFGVWSTVKGLKFEETGSFTSRIVNENRGNVFRLFTRK